MLLQSTIHFYFRGDDEKNLSFIYSAGFLLFDLRSKLFDIERYLNIRSAEVPTFSPDGKRIAFLTNITGTNQIWFVDANGGYPEQITAYQDNISFRRMAAR